MTDTNGSFAAPFLIPGTYTVSVELQGFKEWVRSGIILQVNDRLRIDAGLEVGGIEETTTVVASSPLVRTDSSEIGTVIEERAVKELPLNGRNFATLVYLTPGQAGENLSGASTFNPRGASNFNALGHQANANAWLVDGIDNNEYTFNTVIVAPSVEQVREFKVLSGVFSAEFGRGAGVVSASTKSGSNTLTGTVFEYLRDDVFDARNVFVRKVPAADGSFTVDPKPPFSRHQFGGAAGGPVVVPGVYNGTSRTFFFADYAGLSEERGLTFVNSVPTAEARAGNFSNFRDSRGNLIVVYDPLTTRRDPATGRIVRDPFPGNVTPQDRINPVGANVASIYPLPNGPGNFNNYTSTTNRETTDHSYSGRIDHKLGDNDSFFVRFNYGKFTLDAPQGQAACCLPTPAEAAARFDLGPYVAGIQNTRLTTHGAAFNYTRVLRSNLVNELRVGYARTVPSTFQSDFGRQAATSPGIQGINVTEFTPFTVFLAQGVNNGAPSWPNRIGEGTLDDPSVDLGFDTADFVAPPPNTYGDSGRGILYAPGHVNFDTSLSKRFTLFGRTNAEFRWDAFNLFNHPGFGFPNANIGSPTAGRITSTVVDNRSMQFALKFNF